jgi:hypothetical protein
MNISDQILAIANDDMHTIIDSAKRMDLRLIAVQVRRMEVTLDELVDEAMQEVRSPVVVHFPPQSRMR